MIRNIIKKCYTINFIILGLIVLYAFILRIYRLYSGYVFEGNDAPFIILFGLDIFNSNNIILFLAKLLNYRWGILQPIVIMINVFLLELFKIRFTEFSLTIITAATGSIGILAVYHITKKFRDIYAGIIAAILASTFALYVGLSRNNVGSSLLLPDFILVMAIYLFYSYLTEGKYAFLASFFISIYILSTGTFMGILPILFFMLVITSLRKNNKKNIFSFRDCIKNLFDYKILVLPILTVIVMISNYVLLSYFNLEEMGYLGHILERPSSPGFYLQDFINFFVLNTGFLFSIFLLGGFIYGTIKLIRLEREGIFTIWAIVYLLPFIFLVSPSKTLVRSYLGTGTLPLIILFAIFTMDLYKYLKKKVNRKIAITLVAVLLSISFLSCLFNTLNIVFQTPGDKGTFYGSIVQNNGAKSAGYYIRHISSKSSIIFTDLGIDSVKYYSNREVVGIKNSQLTKLTKYFSDNKNRIDYAIISTKNENYFLPYLNNFHKVAAIYERDSETLSIYSKQEIEYINIELEFTDKMFDKEFGNMLSLKQDTFKQVLKSSNNNKLGLKISSIPILGSVLKKVLY